MRNVEKWKSSQMYILLRSLRFLMSPPDSTSKNHIASKKMAWASLLWTAWPKITKKLPKFPKFTARKHFFSLKNKNSWFFHHNWSKNHANTQLEWYKQSIAENIFILFFAHTVNLKKQLFDSKLPKMHYNWHQKAYISLLKAIIR